jgi:hypothetical protein
MGHGCQASQDVIPVLKSTCLENLLLVLKAPTVGTVGSSGILLENKERFRTNRNGIITNP